MVAVPTPESSVIANGSAANWSAQPTPRFGACPAPHSERETFAPASNPLTVTFTASRSWRAALGCTTTETAGDVRAGSAEGLDAEDGGVVVGEAPDGATAAEGVNREGAVVGAGDDWLQATASTATLTAASGPRHTMSHSMTSHLAVAGAVEKCR
jgi:hypothetical protein